MNLEILIQFNNNKGLLINLRNEPSLRGAVVKAAVKTAERLWVRSWPESFGVRGASVKIQTKRNLTMLQKYRSSFNHEEIDVKIKKSSLLRLQEWHRYRRSRRTCERSGPHRSSSHTAHPCRGAGDGWLSPRAPWNLPGRLASSSATCLRRTSLRAGDRGKSRGDGKRAPKLQRTTWKEKENVFNDLKFKAVIERS